LQWYKKIFGRVYAAYALTIFVLLLPAAYVLFRLINTFSSPQSKEQNIHDAFNVWMDIFMPIIFCKVTRVGSQHFSQGQSYIVIANHTSLMDIPVSKPGIPLPNKTLGKMSFSRPPIFGYIYKLGSILVDRNNARSRAESFIIMKQTLQKGISICLYPEGTRNKSQEVLLPFHNGAFKLSWDTNTPIIPAIILGTKNILPPNGLTFWAWPHRVQFIFLDAVYPKDFADAEELKQHCFTIMKIALSK
jgi:1-acyl-sn-glycerol-3-phosphate acyltransferase